MSNIFLSDKLGREARELRTPRRRRREESPVPTSISARRKVGATSLELPVFGLGTAHLAELYNLVAESDSRATLEAAWQSGVRYFDTAPWYGRGLSEHRLGGFLRTQPRAEFQITTKVGRTLHRPKDLKTFSRAPWTGGLNFEVRFDYSYDGVMRSYEQALQRLALDTVDALVIHDLDAGFHGDALAAHERQLFDSGIRALQELKGSGDIKAFGIGVNTGEALETTAARAPVRFRARGDAVHSARSGEPAHRDGVLLKRGVSVIIGAPFASGILVTGSQAGAKYAYGQASPEVQAARSAHRGGLSARMACRCRPPRCNSRLRIPPLSRSSPAPRARARSHRTSPRSACRSRARSGSISRTRGSSTRTRRFPLGN